MNHSRLSQLVAEFVPLNRRRIAGDPPLALLELERWRELRDLLAYEFGHKPPVRGETERPLRVPTHLKVRYGESHAEAVLSNLSEGGVFVRSEAPLAIGTPLRLQIEPDDADACIDVDAVVTWFREIENLDGPAGFGVSFQNLGAAEAVAIGQLIERALRETAGS
ncbi:MAG: PilZ domain-containing protein [Myxococcales bacterium]|nr:PilZ domain-containing protein [Myxococcales bacterium]